MIKEVNRAIEKLRNRVTGMIVRGILKTINDTDGMPIVQVKISSDEVRDGLELFEPYGFAHKPGAGSECLVVFVGGARDHGIVLSASDRRERPTGMAAGEVCLYDANGTKVLLKNDGTVEIAGNSDFAALASKVDTEMTRLKNDLLALKGATAIGLGASLPGAGSATASAFNATLALIPTNPSPTGSTKVKMS